MKIKNEDIIAVRKTGNNFKVSWKMTNWCNYRCKYCYMANEVSKGNNHTPIETVIKIASKIDEIIEKQAKGRKVLLHLIGGEIGQYDLIEVIKQIKHPLLSRIIFVTNFSNSLEYWNEIIDYCKSRNITPSIIASFHLEQCDEIEFVEKCLKIKPKVKCVISSENINQFKPYLDILKQHKIRIEATIKRDEENKCEQLKGDNLKYVDELNDELRKTSATYYEVEMRDGTIIPFLANIEFINSIDLGGFDSEGFLCTAGIDGIRIRPDGGLQRAGCKMSFLHGRLGSLLGEYELPTKPIVCTSKYIDNDGIEKIKYCTCFGNTTMTRIKNDK